MEQVTFKDFAKLMTKRRRTVDDLVNIFRGKLDDSRGFFERVASGATLKQAVTKTEATL